MEKSQKKGDRKESYDIVRSHYEALRAKHKRLCSFETLDSEFEISRIEDERFLLRSIRQMIGERIGFLANSLNDLLHPSEAGYASLRESTVFSEEEKAQIHELFKKLMYFDRWNLELSIQDSDELNAAFIEEVIKVWPTIKTAVLRYFKRLKESWTKETTRKDVEGYFG